MNSKRRVHFASLCLKSFFSSLQPKSEKNLSLHICKDTVWDDQHSLSWLMRWIQHGQRSRLNVFVRQACSPISFPFFFFAGSSQGRPCRLPNWIKYIWCLPLCSSAPPWMRWARRRASALMLLFFSTSWTALGGFTATSWLVDGEAHHHYRIMNSFSQKSWSWKLVF